ncbi:50S ribosomal protein L23 [Candidatus Dojkabacteria bacterium]|uniref:Large ribosomal subunit protein uL23 n=1 Tax=Candidatus Dojkabacteria bacterium TaxID=2099670 RepID=A0A955HWX8_9BACT|nr:50S ribosomal protein L23 [Candidatus Dojkabacteria bacterium]MCB9790807.1 50S ribosomal protein L23 [Candidatus Nomurabacteria bacterium]
MKNNLLKPVISEKSYNLANEQNQYTFSVDLKASKIEIKKAVEKEYKVTVLNVNVITQPGKMKFNWKIGKAFRAGDSRKAIVTLKQGDKIDDFFNL